MWTALPLCSSLYLVSRVLFAIRAGRSPSALVLITFCAALLSVLKPHRFVYTLTALTTSLAFPYFVHEPTFVLPILIPSSRDILDTQQIFPVHTR